MQDPLPGRRSRQTGRLRADARQHRRHHQAIPLLSAATPARRLIADKAYDADSLRNWLKQRRISAVIPSTASRRTPYPLDKPSYRRRNVIERLFCRLKNWRRIATRYDRHASNYLAAIALVATVAEWIK